MQPRWSALSDRALAAQVPMRASLVFPACERAGAQTVRILCLFSAYKMLYCAETGQHWAAAGPLTGNRLKWDLQVIEK
jgi:hypothetical protein